MSGMPALGQTTERVSVAASGSQPIGGRYTPRPSVSADGSTIAFESPIATLVAGDTNSVSDIFVAAGGGITRVTGLAGAQANCTSQRASVSADGQFVAFDSCASNLVAGDANSVSDVFLLDRNTNALTRVSVSSAEVEGNGPSFSAAVSPNGQFVAFLTQATNLEGSGPTGTYVIVRDVVNGNTFIASRATGVAGALALSDVRPSVANDGTVAFASTSATVVGAGDTNGVSDVFLRQGATSGAADHGAGEPVGERCAAGLGRRRARRSAPMRSWSRSRPPSGAVPADLNGLTDIYVRDLAAAHHDPRVACAVGIRRQRQQPRRVHQPGRRLRGRSRRRPPTSRAPFDATFDIYRATISRAASPVSVTALIRISTSSTTATGDSAGGDVADTGRVVFSSDDPNLVAGDLNGDTDVFSTDGTTTRVTVTGAGLPESYSGLSLRPAPSYDGTVVAFLSSATNLVSGDTNGAHRRLRAQPRHRLDRAPADSEWLRELRRPTGCRSATTGASSRTTAAPRSSTTASTARRTTVSAATARRQRVRGGPATRQPERPLCRLRDRRGLRPGRHQRPGSMSTASIASRAPTSW